MNSQVLRSLSYGVYAVTTMDGQRPTGCIANSTMQITSVPATLAVSINHENFTKECLVKNGKFAICIMSENVTPSVIGTFGYNSGRDINKFETVPYEMIDGVPVIKEACGYIICKVVDTFETTTHTIFLGEMIGGEVLKAEEPMTYAYYHRVIKGSSPKNAPTYIPDADESTGAAGGQAAGNAVSAGTAAVGAGAVSADALKAVPITEKPKQWVCEVCGYIYEGAEVPDDYKCPICGVGKDKFALKA